MSSRDNNPKQATSSRKATSSNKSQSRSTQSASSSSSSSASSRTTKHISPPIANISTSNNKSNENSNSTNHSNNNNKNKYNSTKQKPPSNNNQRPSTSTSRAKTSSSCSVKVKTSSSTPSSFKKRANNEKVLVELEKEDMNSSEMATTNEINVEPKEDILVEIETNVDKVEGEDDDDDDEKSNLLSTTNNANTSSKNTTTNYHDHSLNSSQKNNNMMVSNKQPLPEGWEQHRDKNGVYYWHVSSGLIQRTRPGLEMDTSKGSLLICHDDEEINVNGNPASSGFRKASTDYSLGDEEEDDFYDLSGAGAALTVNDTTTAASTATIVNEANGDDDKANEFVVYPLGCCEFDETQLVSTTSTKLIQKCILKLSNRPTNDDEVVCWGLTQSQPVLLKLFDDYIQFTDLTSKTLLRSQPIQTIKTWAVDDDNNFSFVIEDRPEQLAFGLTTAQTTVPNGDQDYLDNLEYELLNEPTLICYVFHSMDDDDNMSLKVASKLNEQINRYKEQLTNRISKSTRVQQMRVEQKPLSAKIFNNDKDATDVDEDFNDDNGDQDDDNELEANNEMTINVKYIGKTPVPKPIGIEVLNVAIDKCLAEASKAQINRSIAMQQQQLDNDNSQQNQSQLEEALIEAKLHVSPSSVIVENTCTGEIIVECRIRFLTFMGISKRDIRWCGFIMQNATNKSFVAHCFECYPTAGHVCEAIQLSCSRMYEKVVKNSSNRHHHEPEEPEAISIIPSKSRIRNTLAKTLLRIRLNPLISNLH